MKPQISTPSPHNTDVSTFFTRDDLEGAFAAWRRGAAASSPPVRRTFTEGPRNGRDALSRAAHGDDPRRSSTGRERLAAVTSRTRHERVRLLPYRSDSRPAQRAVVERATKLYRRCGRDLYAGGVRARVSTVAGALTARQALALKSSLCGHAARATRHSVRGRHKVNAALRCARI